MEKEGEGGSRGEDTVWYIVRGTYHVHSRRRSLTQTFTHADVHSRRHPMRGSQKEGVAPEGGQLVHAAHGGPKESCMLRRLTLYKHDWSHDWSHD